MTIMKRETKEAIVSDLKDKIEKSQAMFLTNLIGIPSNDAVRIRKTVRDAKGGMVVTRNSLFERAAKGTKAEALLSSLKGPKAVAFAFDDAAAVAKAVYEASKEFEDKVLVYGGLLGDKELKTAEVLALAKLPSRDQMLSTLLATFNAPVSAFARVLEAIRKQKEEATA